MKKVTIYSTPACVYCNMTKAFFKEKGIEYTEHNVAVDTVKREEMVTKSGQMGVPVISVVDERGTEELIVGFDKGALSALLGV